MTFSFKQVLALIALSSIAVLGGSGAVQARIDENFETYKARALKQFALVGKAAGTETDTVEYHYLLKISAKELALSPGYAAGLSVITKKGKISEAKMMFKLGANWVGGLQMAEIHGFSFIYECLGRKIPEGKARATLEFNAFKLPFEGASTGAPRSLRYPGSKLAVLMSHGDPGSPIIEIRPAAAPPAASSKP